MQNITQNNAKEDEKLLYKELSYSLQGAVFDVYKIYRNSQKEIVYHNTLIEKLKEKGIAVIKNKQIPILYKEKKMGTYTPDLIIEEKIILEIKAKPMILRSDTNQFWHYLKATPYKVGYLINFGRSNGVEIIRRVYDTARFSVVSRPVSRSFA